MPPSFPVTDPPNPPRIALLACNVIEAEIAVLTRDASHLVETRFFEIGLHDRPDHLRATLQEAMDALDARDDIDAVVFAYGLCGLGTAGLRPGRHPMVIPRAHDCITFFMGSKEAYADHQRRCPSCYYYTPGWNRARRVPGPDMFDNLRKDLSARFDEEDVDFLVESQREQLAMHDTTCYLDLGTPDAEVEKDYARQCADWMGWKFEHLPSDPTLLRDLLWGRWDDARFQIVPPGMQLSQTPDSSIVRAAQPQAPRP